MTLLNKHGTLAFCTRTVCELNYHAFGMTSLMGRVKKI